jgi:hypothetical protein
MFPTFNRSRSVVYAVSLALTLLSVRLAAQMPLETQREVVDPQTLDPFNLGMISQPPSLTQQPGRLIDQRLSTQSPAERAPFRFGVSFTPEQSVLDSTDTLSAHTISTQIGFPIQTYPNGILLSLSSLKYTQLSTDAVLPVSRTPIPDELWDFRTGFFITRELDHGWKYGALVSAGSASDQPFASADELTLTTLGFLDVPARNQDSWIFSLFYSPTSQVRFPIPGIAYAWRPNDQLEARIGLPASLVYTPNDSFTLLARYTPVTNLLVEARQRFYRDWSAFARYQIINEIYFLAERENRRDRFFLFEHQLAAGLTRQLPAGFSLDLGAAYIFDRRLFLSDEFDLSSDNRIEVDPGVSYSLQLIWTL